MRWIGISALLIAACLNIPTAYGKACLPPEEPYPYPPPDDDPALREFINDEYGRYVLAIERYIECLDHERDRAFAESKGVTERWIRYFGTDAAIKVD